MHFLDEIAVSSFSIVIFHYCYCKVNYQYCHGPLLVMAFNCAHTGIGISALLFSTSMGTSHYLHCHANMPALVMAFSPLPIMAFNCAITGIDISAFWFSTSIGTYHYWNWHSLLVPVLVLAFLNLGSVPVLAHTITGTGIQK